MKEHHIGKEIGKEVRKQNLSEVINGEVDELCIIGEAQLEDIADEYFSNVRKKPLLICHDNNVSVSDIFHKACERAFGAGMVKAVKTNSKEINALKLQLDSLASLPQKVIEIYWGERDYDDIILLAEKLAAASGKFVILYWRQTNSLMCGAGGHIEYDNIVEHCFDTWHKRVNMFVADNKDNDFCRRLEIYNSCRLPKDYISRVCNLYGEDKEEEAREVLEEAFKKRNTFKVFKEEDLGDAIRYYVVSAVPTASEREMLSKCGENPILTMWYDVLKENGEIFNCEHTNSTQMISHQIDEGHYPDSRKAFEEYIQQQNK